MPCEIFVNPTDRVPQYFDEEIRTRRPITAHMFATGTILYDRDEDAERLVQEARRRLEDLPEGLTGLKATMAAYGPATMFEDAEDLVERDPEGAALLLGNAVYDLVQFQLKKEAGWIPRHKEFLSRLRQLDPVSADLVIRATGSHSIEVRIAAGRELCQRITGHSGFFEWETDPDECSPPTA